MDSVPEAFSVVLHQRASRRRLTQLVLLILIKISHRRVVQLDVYLTDAHRLEDHSSVSDDIFGINVFADFEFDCTDIEIAAQRPEVRLLYGINSGESGNFLITSRQDSVEAGGLSLHENRDRFLNK